MLGAWKIAPSSTLRLIDSNNEKFHRLPFSNGRLSLSISSNVLCSSSSSSSFAVADEEEEKIGRSAIPPNLPADGKPTRKSKGKGVKKPSGIQVPRQKHIPVSKSDLLEALASTMFPSQQELSDQLRLIASCLDSILHAEQRGILEEMRADYFLLHPIKRNESDELEVGEDSFSDADHGFNDDTDDISMDSSEDETSESQNQMNFPFNLDLMDVIGSLTEASLSKSIDKSSMSTMASTARFQRSFMKLLHAAHFEDLTARDLKLTSSLNTDYLLTLPIYVDWEKASESNAIIFRRGYATEKQQGKLVVEKLDYIQSRLIQAVFGLVSKPLRSLGLWINEALNRSDKTQEIQTWIRKIQLWLDDVSRKSSSPSKNKTSEPLSDFEQEIDDDLPLWLASQKAVSRYEGFLSAIGPRGRLLQKLLSSIGLVQLAPETDYDFESECAAAASESYLRPVFLPRVSLSDIWKPATRKYCGNDIWKILRTGISVIFSESVLQEPAFRELVLLYTEDSSDEERRDSAEIPSLQLKIYEQIPIPDLPVIFPHKKLSFRLLDMVRLDIATILGLLAYFINYKFEDFTAEFWISPESVSARLREVQAYGSAIVLDVIAVSALVILGSRVALGYKQTWDRYQLLVNKTLYEKTLASGFGTVQFLVDASEQQQYKECILTYAVLLKAENGQVSSNEVLAEECERFLYEAFREKVEMPVEKAVNTLMKLGLVREHAIDGKAELQATPPSMAYTSLRKQWDSLLTKI